MHNVENELRKYMQFRSRQIPLLYFERVQSSRTERTDIEIWPIFV